MAFRGILLTPRKQLLSHVHPLARAGTPQCGRPRTSSPSPGTDHKRSSPVSTSGNLRSLSPYTIPHPIFSAASTARPSRSPCHAAQLKLDMRGELVTDSCQYNHGAKSLVSTLHQVSPVCIQDPFKVPRSFVESWNKVHAKTTTVRRCSHWSEVSPFPTSVIPPRP